MRHLPNITFISIILFASLSLPSLADSSPPTHTCVKPENPGKLASEVRMKGFQKEINDYRDCINKFAQEQKNQSENHLTAGNKAVDEFNVFVKTELNPKKEDEAAK